MCDDSKEDKVIAFPPPWVIHGREFLATLLERKKLQEPAMNEPGDLIKAGEVTIPYFCALCTYEVRIKHTQYNAGIASPLEDVPLVCPACCNEVNWLTEEEYNRREEEHPAKSCD